MPDYPVQELLWNAGEGIVKDDLNNGQRYLRAQLWDLLARGMGRDGIDEFGLWQFDRLRSLGGAPRTSATTRTITNDAGLLLVKHGVGAETAIGADPYTMVYRLAANELSSQLTAGDATNPRIDLVCVKLENIENDAADNESRIIQDLTTEAESVATFVKRRKVKLTKQVVEGTPAGSPVQPSVPAGFVKWAAVYVPATWNAVIDVENIWDFRVPLGVDAHVTYTWPNGGDYLINTGWTANGNGYITSAAGGDVAYVFPGARGLHDARLTRIAISGLLDGGSSVHLVRVVHEPTSAGAIGVTVLEDLTASFNSGANSLHQHDLIANTTKPYWGNGFTAGVAALRDPKALPNDARLTTIGVRLTAGAASKRCRFVKFDFAAA